MNTTPFDLLLTFHCYDNNERHYSMIQFISGENFYKFYCYNSLDLIRTTFRYRLQQSYRTQNYAIYHSDNFDMFSFARDISSHLKFEMYTFPPYDYHRYDETKRFFEIMQKHTN